MTYELEKIWKSYVVDGDGPLGYPIYRYVGTREGVYRIYPGIHLAKNFDPTQQPQSVNIAPIDSGVSTRWGGVWRAMSLVPRLPLRS